MFRNKQLDRIEKKLDTLLSAILREPGSIMWNGEKWVFVDTEVSASVSPTKAPEKKKRKYVKSGKYSKKVTTKKK